MTVVQPLIDLQEVDARIRELEAELKDLPRRKALEVARLSGVTMDLEAAKASKEQLEQRLGALDAEIEDMGTQNRRYKTDQLASDSERAYQQYSAQIAKLDSDIEGAKNRREVIEKDELSKATKKIETSQGKFDEKKAEVDALITEIDERLAQVKAELAEAQAERTEKAKLVQNPKFLLIYERLRTKRWPVVVPLTHEGVCDGCHLQQPPSVAQLVDHNRDLVVCTMCGRILYRD